MTAAALTIPGLETVYEAWKVDAPNRRLTVVCQE